MRNGCLPESTNRIKKKKKNRKLSPCDRIVHLTFAFGFKLTDSRGHSIQKNQSRLTVWKCKFESLRLLIGNQRPSLAISLETLAETSHFTCRATACYQIAFTILLLMRLWNIQGFSGFENREKKTFPCGCNEMQPLSTLSRECSVANFQTSSKPPCFSLEGKKQVFSVTYIT